MQTLKAGDVLKKGDEVRRSDYSEDERRRYTEAREENMKRPKLSRRPESEFHGFDWEPVNRVGDEILPSDLMTLEFRRPE